MRELCIWVVSSLHALIFTASETLLSRGYRSCPNFQQRWMPFFGRVPICKFRSVFLHDLAGRSSLLAAVDQVEPSIDYSRCVSLLQQCIKLQALAEGKLVHLSMTRSGYDRDTYLGNLLVKMYGNCGNVGDAWCAFEGIARRNVFSWNMMMGAFVLNMQQEDARSVFTKMPQMDVVSWNAMIAADAQTGHLEDARSTFATMPQRDTVSWNAMITAYAQNGHSDDAINMFGKMPQQSVISWTAIVTAFAQIGHLEDARIMFNEMPERNDVSWAALVAACAEGGHLEDAKDVLSKMPEWSIAVWNCVIQASAQENYVQDASNLFSTISERNVITWNIMIQAYAQAGQLLEARTMLDRMPLCDVVSCIVMITAYAQNGHLREARSMFNKTAKRDVASWNALIGAYTQNKHLHDAEMIFERMSQHDVVSWTAMVAAYAQNGHVDEAKLLFDKMPSRNVVSWNTMLHASAQSKHLESARIMFDRMPQRDVVSWNTMIAAYAQNGLTRTAIQLVGIMDLESVKLDEITYLNMLDVAALPEGRTLLEEIISSPFLSNVAVANGLGNLRAKCGYLEDAWSIFCKTQHQNLISWSGMVTAFALNGHEQGALKLFQIMALVGIYPNEIVFVSLLSACSHAGLLDAGWKFFILMCGDYGIEPTLDHYLCMIDLLSRAGWLEEAESLINSMPFKPNPMAWMTLLGACKIHGDSERAAQAAQQVSTMDPENGAMKLEP